MHEFEVLSQDFLKWGIKDINQRFPQVRNDIFDKHAAVEFEWESICNDLKLEYIK